MATYEFPVMARGDLAMTGHWYIDTKGDTKSLRLNNRNVVATSGDINAIQSKPNISVGGSTGVCALEVSPRVASGITTTGKVVGVFSNPLSKGITGDVGIMRCFEGKLECPSGSTKTTSEAYVLHCMQSLHGTVTTGPYPIKVDTHGGNVAWAGLALLPDDAQVADSDGGSTADGWVKVKIGTQVTYIPTYNTAH